MNININVRDAVILAGGKGNRLQKGVSGCSKPMIRILGKRMILYVIDSLLECGINNIYIVYHSSTADILTLSTYSEIYQKTLKFIEDTEQNGTLSALYYVKNLVDVPFIMTFADIIVQKDDFRQMVFYGLNTANKHTDLLIQSVNDPSIPFEKLLLIKNGVIIKCDKLGITEPVSEDCMVKAGGLVYLWFKNPFPLITDLSSNKKHSLKQIIQPLIEKQTVLEMPINDIWDVDTQEDVLQTERILRQS